MTQLRKRRGAISNYFDRLTQGIGHRGSSLMDLDRTAVYITHDGKAGRALFQEFKEEGEAVSWGQGQTLQFLAHLRGCTVWLVVRRADGRIGLTVLGRSGPLVLSEAEYRERFRGWWEGVRGEQSVQLPDNFAVGACAGCGLALRGLPLCKTCWRQRTGIEAA